MIRPFEIDLICGRSIKLVTLHQCLVYEGLIQGLPTRERNKQRIEYALKEAADLHHGGQPAYLVPPQETPIDYETNWGRKYPFGDPAALPEVKCVALFTHWQAVGGGNKDYSALPIVWFQDAYALPIASEVLEHIKGIDWNTLAHDWEL